MNVFSTMPWLAGPARPEGLVPGIGANLGRHASFSSVAPFRDALARLHERSSTRSLMKLLRSADPNCDAYYLKFINCAPLLESVPPKSVAVLSVGEGKTSLEARERALSHVPLDRLLRRADWIEVRNDAVAQHLVSRYDCASQVKVLPSGVDTALFSPGDKHEARKRLGMREEAFVIAFVGPAHPHKGAGLAVATVREIPGAILATAGASWTARSSAAIRALGVVGPLAIRDLLRASDAMLFPSADEGMSNALLEALACGTPCVVADACHTGFLSHEHDCLKVGDREVRSWAAALERLRDDPALTHRLGRAAERIAASYSLERRLQLLEGLLTSKR